MFFQTVLLVLLLTYCSGVSYRSVVEEQFEQFKLQHKRTYANEDEEQYRMTVFMDNMHTILEHNKLYEMGISSYSMGMNQFGDLTDEEFHRYYSIPYSDEDNEESPQQNPASISATFFHPDKSLPEEVDWRLVGAVTPVKNQGKCGACYAFVATGALEAQHFFKSRKLVSLSEQNIVDCTYKNSFKNSGCRGGRVDNSFRYIIANNGIDTEYSYPYRTNRQECEFKFFSVGARMSSFVNLPKGNETALLYTVALIGPVAVMVDNSKMKFYSGGIFDEPSCRNNKYNHGMLVVGYGIYKKINYWLVKNSMGEVWGDKGYIMMVRDKDNQCAIATAALYPVV